MLGKVNEMEPMKFMFYYFAFLIVGESLVFICGVFNLIGIQTFFIFLIGLSLVFGLYVWFEEEIDFLVAKAKKEVKGK